MPTAIVHSQKRERLFRHCGFAVLRTPLLPFDGLVEWGERVRAANGSDAPLIRASDLESLDLLRKFVDSPDFIEAIHVASPDLSQAFVDWLGTGGKRDAKRLEHSLIRYFSRASFRCTPFGLFAGCSVMTVGDETRLRLCARSEYTRHSRLDMDHVAELARVIAEDPEARRRLTLYANSSATLVGGRIHYVETRYREREREYSLTAVDPSPEICEILERARTGVRYDALAGSLEQAGFEADEIHAFLSELLDTQLLVPAVQPQLTGTESSAALAADLEQAQYGPEIADVLTRVNANLARLDTRLGNAPSMYHEALAPLFTLPTPVQPSRALQVDLFKPSSELCLGEAVIDELIVAADILSASMIRYDRMSEFASRFADRYETREVSILEALDEEVGIGFPDTESNDQVMRRYGDRMRRRDAVLAELRLRAARSGAPSVELEDADVAGLRVMDQPPTCNALSVLATLIAASEECVNRGEFQVLIHQVLGPSGARLLGRFAHLHPDLESRVREHLRAEEALEPDAIFAEVVHLPQGRIGNVAARPVLRDHEIEYLGRGGADTVNKISLSDLMVSVQRGRVTLRSRCHDREVRPRLTSAHNYSSGRQLPVYRFLAVLQEHETVSGSVWLWGGHGSARSLPRVTRGRLILAAAKWTLDTDDIRSLTVSSDGKAGGHLGAWRAARGIPRYVVLADSDNRMPVDFDNASSAEAFAQLLRPRRSATIEEMIPTPDSLCVKGPEGHFTNEIVVPLIRVVAQTPDSAVTTDHSSPAHLRAAASLAPRQHPPGNEWVYAKLYCGRGSSDFVLREIVALIVDRLAAEGLIEHWHFVRYGDPQFHIRVRFRSAAGSAGRIMEIVSRECCPFVVNGRLAKLAYDTYQPEVERYGGAAAIGVAESLFHADSILVLSALLRQRNGGGSRDMLAVASLDRSFGDAGIAHPERIAALEDALGKPTAAIRRERSTRFRARRSDVESAVAEARGHPSGTWLTDRLDARSRATVGLFRQLHDLQSRGELMQSVQSILLSFLHMSVNRIASQGQAEEAAIYDFLLRHYMSEVARAGASLASIELQGR
jgi:thiopeptide-type bacteriocin biosynthesis protein